MPRRSGTARIQYIDRNPTSKDQSFAGTAAPHALTTRWTYTVPSLRLAVVSVAECLSMRLTAAGTLGLSNSIIDKAAIDLLQSPLQSNTVGDKTTVAIGQSILMLSGEALHGKTSDLSVTGTVLYLVTSSITEFDK